MALPQGIDFRSTSGYVTDPTNCDYEVSTGGNYPRTSAQGNTVGWESTGLTTRNRNASNPANLAGVHISPAGTVKTYRVDLPATGSYNVRLAAGDATYANPVKVELFDDTTSLGVLASTTPTGANKFRDATNAEHTAANWAANNTAFSASFASTIFRIKCGTTSASVVSHFLVESAGGGPTYTLTADSGSVAVTGQDAGLAFNRVLTADSGSVALTGQDATLAFNRVLAADSGSVAVTVQDATLAFNRVLSADSGSVAVTGQDVTLTYTPVSGATYTLLADSGSVAVSGQDATLAFNRVLVADTGSVAVTGQDATLAFNRVLQADSGSVAVTGQDATLTYTTNGYTYTLTAEPGSVAVTGQDARLAYQPVMPEGGGWMPPQSRRKTRKQVYDERVKLGILPKPVIKAAAKIAAIAQTTEEFKEDKPKYEQMFMRELKATKWLPDYTRAIQAQLEIIEQEEEELLLFM